ncbi:hypothetical protein EDB19DRAFT_2031418, partial [Suillus lakei]
MLLLLSHRIFIRMSMHVLPVAWYYLQMQEHRLHASSERCLPTLISCSLVVAHVSSCHSAVGELKGLGCADALETQSNSTVMHICINSGAGQFLTSGCPCLELLFWCCNVHVTPFLILTRSLPSPPGQHSLPHLSRSAVDATLASYVDLCQFNSDESRRDICVPTHRKHAKSASVSEARRGRPLKLLFVSSRMSEISMLREPSLSTRISLYAVYVSLSHLTALARLTSL